MSLPYCVCYVGAHPTIRLTCLPQLRLGLLIRCAEAPQCRTSVVELVSSSICSKGVDGCSSTEDTNILHRVLSVHLHQWSFLKLLSF